MSKLIAIAALGAMLLTLMLALDAPMTRRRRLRPRPRLRLPQRALPRRSLRPRPHPRQQPRQQLPLRQHPRTRQQQRPLPRRHRRPRPRQMASGGGVLGLDIDIETTWQQVFDTVHRPRAELQAIPLIRRAPDGDLSAAFMEEVSTTLRSRTVRHSCLAPGADCPPVAGADGMMQI